MNRLLTLSLVLAAAGVAAPGQVSIGGAMSDSTTGPLAGGTVYHLTSSVTVPAGETLTIGAGAVLKATLGSHLVNVDGTLVVAGTTLDPVIFTVIDDDSAGGDTGADGPTSGTPASWRGLSFDDASDASVVANAEVRYSGNSGFPGIDLNSADVTLTNVTIRDGGNDGLQCSNDSFPTVTGCAFLDNGANAVDDVRLAAVPGFSANTASGNGLDALRITSGTLTADTVIEAANVLEGALVCATSLTLPDGLTLTLEQGVVVKPTFTAFTVNVDGTLVTNGTALAPVVFTSFADDEFGGDTNGDGPSSGAAAGWRALLFDDTADASSLLETRVRFAGQSGFPAIDLNAADATLTNVTVESCANNGLSLSNDSFPTVTGCAFLDNAAEAVDDVRIEALPGFSGNVASGNSRDAIRVNSGTVGADTTVVVDDLINGVLYMTVNLFVPAGVTLNLDAGVVVKPSFSGFTVTVDGTLVTAGTEADPVVFTSFADDEHAGDTNLDGPSTGMPGDFRALVFDLGSDDSVLEGLLVRYAGQSGFAGIDLNGSDVTLIGSTVELCAADALSLSNSSAPDVLDCTFRDNAGIAVDDVPFTSIAGFLDNEASGNDIDALRVNVGTLPSGATATVVRRNVLGGALVAATSWLVESGATLSLDRGVVVKPVFTGYTLTVDGSLFVTGTGDDPVVFTSFVDDAFGGDTNDDGAATTPVPGGLRAIILGAVGEVSSVEGLLLRYAGQSGFDALTVESGDVTLKSVRVEHAANDGFHLEDHDGTAWNLVAYACGDSGFELAGGAFDVSNATAVGNVVGFDRLAPYAGVVRNTNAWGNTTANYLGFVAGDLADSNGDAVLAAIDGNLFSDPLLVDEVGGDLRLTAASPCVDRGDAAVVVGGRDAGGFPRLLDGALDKQRRIDVGAYEFDHVELRITGDPTPGGLLSFDTLGNPALVESYLFIGIDTFELPFKSYGPLFVDVSSLSLVVPWPAAPASVPVTVPASTPTPFSFVAQQLGIEFLPGGAGNLSNPVFLTIE